MKHDLNNKPADIHVLTVASLINRAKKWTVFWESQPIKYSWTFIIDFFVATVKLL